ARGEGVQENVGLLQQAAERRPSLGALQVEHDPALVAVGGMELSALAVHIVHLPPRVPAGRLDLDHVGPELGEGHGREGPGEMMAQVDDPEPRERPLGAHRATGRDCAMRGSPARGPLQYMRCSRMPSSPTSKTCTWWATHAAPSYVLVRSSSTSVRSPSRLISMKVCAGSPSQLAYHWMSRSPMASGPRRS